MLSICTNTYIFFQVIIFAILIACCLQRLSGKLTELGNIHRNTSKFFVDRAPLSEI